MRTPTRNLLAGLLVTAFSTGAFAQTTHDVQLDGFLFVPADITVQKGDTVHWEWVSGIHNVESGTINAGAGVPDGNFRSGDPTGLVGTTFDLLIDQAFLNANPMPDNVYPYYCINHTAVDMAGTITVNIPENVPAASLWGLACMVLILLGVSSILLARKRRANAVNA